MNTQPPLATQFVPRHWLELACWHRPMVVYARPMPVPEPRAVALSHETKPENCKVPLLPRIRPAA